MELGQLWFLLCVQISSNLFISLLDVGCLIWKLGSCQQLTVRYDSENDFFFSYSTMDEFNKWNTLSMYCEQFPQTDRLRERLKFTFHCLFKNKYKSTGKNVILGNFFWRFTLLSTHEVTTVNSEYILPLFLQGDNFRTVNL